MKMNIKLWIWGAFFLISTSQNGLAQSLSGEDSIFDSIRIEMMSIAKENNALVQQNKKLKTRLISLQLEVDRSEKEIKELDSDFIVEEGAVSEQNTMRPGEQTSSKDLENDPLIREAQDLYLSGQSMDLAPEQKLRELQLYDLQIQKQEYLLDLKDKETLYQGVESGRQQELDAYKKEIQETRKKENDLFLRVAEMEKRAMSYPQEIDLLKMENKELKRKMALLKQMLSK